MRDSGERWTNDRLERPEGRGWRGDGGKMVRPVRTLIDPGAKQSNLFRSQRIALLRHSLVGDQTGNEMNQRAVCASTWNDGRTGITTGKRLLLHVEAQFAFLFIGPVTRVTVLREDGLDNLGKANQPCSRRRKFSEVDRNGFSQNRPAYEQCAPEDCCRMAGQKMLYAHGIKGCACIL